MFSTGYILTQFEDWKFFWLIKIDNIEIWQKILNIEKASIFNKNLKIVIEKIWMQLRCP